MALQCLSRRLAPPTSAALLCTLVCTGLLALPTPAQSPSPEQNSRWIVGFDRSVSATDEWLDTNNVTGTANTSWLRRGSGNTRVLQLSANFADTYASINQLINDPDINAVVADVWVRTTASKEVGEIDRSEFNDAVAQSITGPDDPMFEAQWQLHDDVWQAASIDAVNAWRITQGASDTVIAVIDTGIRPEHPDLTGRLLPGYDFVSGLDETFEASDAFPPHLIYSRSNDGDGRDSDPTDPGDGVDAELVSAMAEHNIECEISESTWHGTCVSSLIAANANDGVGLAGVDWNAMILPVRAIGRCGGHRSDLLDAIRWAAGVEDPDLPPNPTPAHIINLSLGMDDICSVMDQAAINDAVNAGAIIVAAVGNQGRNTAEHPSSPSQCQNVIGVLATDETGYLASYSNFGRDADIAAPGGMRFPSQFGVEVATNGGLLGENEVQTWKSVSGTSVAAPLVSGTLGLMRSVQPNLTPNELTNLLLSSAAPFPDHWDTRYGVPCDTSTCGSGLLNSHHAVRTAVAYVPGSDDQMDQPFNDGVESSPSDAIIVGGVAMGCSIVNVQQNRRTLTSGQFDPSLLLLFLVSVIVVQRRLSSNRAHA